MIDSPDKNYLPKIGKRGKMGNVFAQKTLRIPVSEKYQDMIKSGDNGGLPDLKYKDGNTIVINTVSDT